MIRFLNKWVRKFHRWIAIPTALLIISAAGIKFLGSAEIRAAWERIDQLPSLLMLIMAISGTYLFLVPYINRSRRKNTQQKEAEAVKGSARMME